MELIINKNSNESNRKLSQIRQNVLIQKQLQERAIEILRKTIENVDEESEHKDNRNNF